MLNALKIFSTQRSAWLLLFFSAAALEGTALYFQHGMGLQPCVLCVYERLAMVGLMVAGLLGALAPSNLFFRLLALAVGLFSAIKGLLVSVRHLDLQINPAPWKQFEFLPNFPETMPFHQWFPAIFNPTGSCDNSQWSLFGITMVQWLVFIFAVYALLLILISLAQFKKARRNRSLFK